MLHIIPNIRNSNHQLFRKNVAEARKGFRSALLLLIVSHDQLDELPSVDVRVPRLLDILDQFNRDVRRESAS